MRAKMTILFAFKVGIFSFLAGVSLAWLKPHLVDPQSNLFHVFSYTIFLLLLLSMVALAGVVAVSISDWVEKLKDESNLYNPKQEIDDRKS